MNRLGIVAWYEFSTNVKKPSFLFSLIGLPLFTIVIMVVVALVTATSVNSGEITGDHIGYVDSTEILSAEVEIPKGWVALATEDEAKIEIEAKRIEAYFVLDNTFLATGAVAFYANGTAPESVQDAVVGFVKTNLVAKTNSDLPSQLLEKPVSLRIFLNNTGREINETGFIVLFLTPMVFLIVFMMALQLSSSFLMSGVVEEKTNRVMELLITTVKPYELLGGKVLGLGVLGLIQLGVWIIFGIISFMLTRNIESLEGVYLPWDLIILAIIYFFLSYFLYGSFLAGVGAISESEQESRQYAGIISLVLVIPFLAIAEFMTNPNGAIATILSMVPFTAGMAMLLRVAFTAVPLWQIVLSLSISFVTVVLVVYASARVFKWATLMYGKRITIRELWRVIRSNPEMGGVA